MRILLASVASYAPPRGGSTRSNLAWLERLAQAGHECLVVCGSAPGSAANVRREIEEQRIAIRRIPERSSPGVEVVDREGIVICSVEDTGRLRSILGEQIRTFRPDWVLVSSEDLGQTLLREAHQAAPGRVVYLAHTPQMFPFGPASFNPNPSGAQWVAQSAAVVAIGENTAAYIERHAGVRPAVIHPPVYGEPPFPQLGRFDNRYILMVNPCAVKGLSIFTAVAERFPSLQFAALPGWGTTDEVRATLARLPNVTVLKKCRHIDEVLADTRVLLMPSLWHEGFGLIATEAMLRGIPVLASDMGGLVEAKLGTRFVLPVRPIERYRAVFDEQRMPLPELPEQDLAPWADALASLTSDRAVYELESEASRHAALSFVSGVRPSQMEEFLASLEPNASLDKAPLRVLLVQNSQYYPAHGGGDKSNRLLVEGLAALGHVCRVVARAGAKAASNTGDAYLAELARRGVQPASVSGDAVQFALGGVDVHAVTNAPNLRAYLGAQIREFKPDAIVTSTDDPAQLLFDVAIESGAPVVFLARTTLALPFGPEAAQESETWTKQLKRAAGVVGVSRYVARYIHRWSGIDAIHLPISLLEPGPWPELGRYDNEFVTFVNPCAVKGIAVFLALADRMPAVQFAAVPTWGTNESDLAALRARPNVTLLDPVDDIDRLLERTRVLLAPSLWAEARSRIVVEAMLRGAPVLAADVGGIPEAMMGVDYLLPVRQIERYRRQVDNQMVPVAEVPEQDIEPWHAALEELLSDRQRYERLSARAREAALAYAGGLSAAPFADYLRERRRREKPAVRMEAAPSTEDRISRLSPEKRALLALRLRKKAAPQKGAWIATADVRPDAALRLFCFPYAGGGASAFRGWPERLPESVAVCPVRLPGREARAAEPAYDRIEPLAEALVEALRPYLNRPFAFFGHSMGGLLAFEVARRLRKRGMPGPAALLLSAARAPRFRLGHAPLPEPSEEEFLEELRRRDGTPTEVLDNPELMRLILPALRADTALCRAYSYCPEPPLACPIRAYAGADDPNLRPEHIDPWREQTSASFVMRVIPGSHFFLHTAQEEFLAALADDLTHL